MHLSIEHFAVEDLSLSVLIISIKVAESMDMINAWMAPKILETINIKKLETKIIHLKKSNIGILKFKSGHNKYLFSIFKANEYFVYLTFSCIETQFESDRIDILSIIDSFEFLDTEDKVEDMNKKLWPKRSLETANISNIIMGSFMIPKLTWSG
jgi:hypothetical protein